MTRVWGHLVLVRDEDRERMTHIATAASTTLPEPLLKIVFLCFCNEMSSVMMLGKTHTELL